VNTKRRRDSIRYHELGPLALS